MLQTLEPQTHFDSFQELISAPSVGAIERRFMAGSVIYEDFTPAASLHFISAGQVRIYQGGPHGSDRLIEILGPGNWHGTAVLGGTPLYGKRAVAVTDVTALLMDGLRLLESLKTHPTAAIELVRQLAGRLRVAHEDSAVLVYDDCTNRVIRTLLRFSETSAAKATENGVVLQITHAQLAKAIGAARETVSVCLTHLRLKNVLQTGRNRLSFNPTTLRALQTN
jgi:CRP-like cAMP-binding protein